VFSVLVPIVEFFEESSEDKDSNSTVRPFPKYISRVEVRYRCVGPVESVTSKYGTSPLRYLRLVISTVECIGTKNSEWSSPDGAKKRRLIFSKLFEELLFELNFCNTHFFNSVNVIVRRPHFVRICPTTQTLSYSSFSQHTVELAARATDEWDASLVLV